MKTSKRMTCRIWTCDCPECGEMVDCGSSGDGIGLGATDGIGVTKCDACGCEFKVTK